MLVSFTGTKTFRSRYRVGGKWKTRNLGRFGAQAATADGKTVPITLKWAREQVDIDRAHAREGRDPAERYRVQAPEVEEVVTYEAVVDKFIALYAKPTQRTWQQTERALKINCKIWLKKPFDSITKANARDLLDGLIAEGHGPTARVTLAWLRKLWDWASERDILSNLNMRTVKIEYERRVRDRCFTDHELKAIWFAAEQLPSVESAYVKLLILLAPRKSALAGMRRSELDKDVTLWTTPHERTKSKKTASKKRTYLTPLPPLAQRILKPMLKEDSELVFPGRIKGKPINAGSSLQASLIRHGAPKDFTFHAMRHTLATWFQNKRSEGEIGLLLNHSASSVTAGYMHAYALDLKRTLLEEWAAHVEELVTAKGTVRLR